MSQNPKRQTTVPELIGWLSLCILAASWGSAIEPGWRHIWNHMGLFGLAASVGLQVVHRSRVARRRRREQANWQQCLEKRLQHYLSDDEATETLRMAVERIIEDLEQRGLWYPEEQSQAAPTFDRPLRIVAHDSGGRMIDSSFSVGYLQQITAPQIEFLHKDSLPSDGRILIAYELLDRGMLTLAAEIVWLQPIDQAWTCVGAKLIAEPGLTPEGRLHQPAQGVQLTVGS